VSERLHKAALAAATEHLDAAIEILGDLSYDALAVAATLAEAERLEYLSAERRYARARRSVEKARALLSDD
jgi:hypothetical protein